MKRLALLITVLFLTSAVAFGDVISTDRFGYTGTVTRYESLQDAQNGDNPIETISVGNRDLSLFIVDGQSSYYSDSTIIMGSWWYTTDPSGNAGYGNTSGNTGLGFIQLYEDPAAGAGVLTRDSATMAFGDFNGTNYTSFSANITGTNSDPYARLTATQSNTNDSGIFLSYALNLTAGGLEGLLSGGTIVATNHPTTVTGSFTGLFQNTTTDNAGFYKFDLTLDTTNWAFDNLENLTGAYPFAASYFAQQVPEPSFLLLLGLGIGAVSMASLRRK